MGVRDQVSKNIYRTWPSRPRRRRISPTYLLEFPWSRSRRLTSQAAAEFFSAPPPSHLMTSFSTQSMNFSVQFIQYQKRGKWPIIVNALCLKMNKLKTKEVVFYDSRRRHKVSPPLPLPDVDRITTLKVLGVTLNNTCQRRSTSTMSSAIVPRHCMPCVSYATMAWMKQVFRRSSGQLWCLDWCTHRLRGGDL